MIGRFKYLVSLADDADEASIKQYIGEIKEANYEEATCVENNPYDFAAFTLCCAFMCAAPLCTW